MNAIYPVQIAGHFGVDAKFVFLPAAFSPGHQAYEKPCIMKPCHHWTPTVPLTSIFDLPQHAPTKHVLSEVVHHMPGTLFVVYNWNFNEVEGWTVAMRGLVVLPPASNNCDSTVTMQHSFGHVLAREACWKYVCGKFGWCSQAQKSYIIVHSERVVLWVGNRLFYSKGHLRSFNPKSVIVTWRDSHTIRIQNHRVFMDGYVLWLVKKRKAASLFIYCCYFLQRLGLSQEQNNISQDTFTAIRQTVGIPWVELTCLLREHNTVSRLSFGIYFHLWGLSLVNNTKLCVLALLCGKLL